jgi:hypothetical protein
MHPHITKRLPEVKKQGEETEGSNLRSHHQVETERPPGKFGDQDHIWY